jgi:hypothetical protein
VGVHANRVIAKKKDLFHIMGGEHKREEGSPSLTTDDSKEPRAKISERARDWRKSGCDGGRLISSSCGISPSSGQERILEPRTRGKCDEFGVNSPLDSYFYFFIFHFCRCTPRASPIRVGQVRYCGPFLSSGVARGGMATCSGGAS